MPLSHSKLWKAFDTLARREGLSVSGLARRAGLDATTFNPSKRFGPGEPPRPRWPSTDSLVRVLEATGTSLSDFALMAEDSPPRPSRILQLSMALAAEAGYFDAEGYPVGDGWQQADLPTPREGLFGLRITDDAMAPLYREGDLVIVDREATGVQTGDRIVARFRSGETVATELGACDADTVTLSSINPLHPPRDVAATDIAWMARILWVSQ